jgi:prepilin peptidase CpaA
MILPIPLLAPLAVGLACAVVCDLRRRRIPNVVPGFLLVSGLAINAHHGGVHAFLSGLGASLLLLLLIYPAWRAGGIGGGDVKVAAATGAWLGLGHLLWFVLAGAVAGGVVAAIGYCFASPEVRADVRANIVLAGLHGRLPPAQASHRKSGVSIPYALAISAGAAVELLLG